MKTSYFFQGTYGYILGHVSIVSNFATLVSVYHDGTPENHAKGMNECLLNMQQIHFNTPDIPEGMKRNDVHPDNCRWHVVSWTKLDS